MVQLILRLPARRGGIPELLRALRSVMRAAMSMPGLVRSELYADTSRPGALLYVEEWSSVEDARREIRTERFTRLLSVMEAAASRPDLELRFVSEIRGLEYVDAVRRAGGADRAGVS